MQRLAAYAARVNLARGCYAAASTIPSKERSLIPLYLKGVQGFLGLNIGGNIEFRPPFLLGSRDPAAHAAHVSLG